MRNNHKRALFEKLSSVLVLTGFDDDDTDDGDDDTDDDDDEGEEDDKKKDPPKSKGDDVEGLKKALKAERQLRRQAQRELKEKARKDASDKSEEDNRKNSEEAIEAKVKVSRLADRLAKEAVDNAIVRLAAEMKFADLEDPLGLIKRADIDFDQDADDPSEISVDLDSVREALEDLAKRKPHLLKSKESDDDDEDDDGDDNRKGNRKTGSTGSRGAGKHKSKKKSEADQDRDLMSGYGAFRAR